MYRHFVPPAALAAVLAASFTTHDAWASQPAPCVATSATPISSVDPQVQLAQLQTSTGPEAPATPSHSPIATTTGGTEKQLIPLHPHKGTIPRGSVELKDHTGKVCHPFDVWLGTEAGTNFRTINSCYVGPRSVATCTFPPSGGGPLKIHCLKKGDAKVVVEATEFYTGKIVTMGFLLHCQ